MRHFFMGILLPFILTSLPSHILAREIPLGNSHQHTALAPDRDKFYTKSAYLVQQQLNLLYRLQKALNSPDANRMRAVRGQLMNQTISIDNFLKRQYPHPQGVCSPDFSYQSSLPVKFDESTGKIYCGLYNSSQELFKLRPLLDQLLSRRGEIGLVRELPLVSGEKKSDAILPIVTVQRPNLDQPAQPFAKREPEKVISSPVPIIGKHQKPAIANYEPPIQPAIVAPVSAMKILANASQFLQTAQLAFPENIRFIDPQETEITLRRLAYDVIDQDVKTYRKFLELPNTGIARILTDSVYRRRLNSVTNRLETPVNNYPVDYPVNLQFTTEDNFNPGVALQLVNDRFQLVPENINYGFMVDVGDIDLSQLDGNLKPVKESIKNFFLGYKPPTTLESLQVDRRRFLTGKEQVWNLPEVILADARVELNRTYLLRSLQFKLPEIILTKQPISRSNSRAKQRLGQVPSSDTIIALRTVRNHRDGSYTILWKIIQHLPAPQIEDLENYVQY